MHHAEVLSPLFQLPFCRSWQTDVQSHQNHVFSSLNKPSSSAVSSHRANAPALSILGGLPEFTIAYQWFSCTKSLKLDTVFYMWSNKCPRKESNPFGPLAVPLLVQTRMLRVFSATGWCSGSWSSQQNWSPASLDCCTGYFLFKCRRLSLPTSLRFLFAHPFDLVSTAGSSI